MCSEKIDIALFKGAVFGTVVNLIPWLAMLKLLQFVRLISVVNGSGRLSYFENA